LRSLASGRGSFVKTRRRLFWTDLKWPSTIVDSSRIYDRQRTNIISGRCGSVELLLQQFLCRFGAVGAVCRHMIDAITLDVE